MTAPLVAADSALATQELQAKFDALQADLNHTKPRAHGADEQSSLLDKAAEKSHGGSRGPSPRPLWLNGMVAVHFFSPLFHRADIFCG
jgi:hypothetical protein